MIYLDRGKFCLFKRQQRSYLYTLRGVFFFSHFFSMDHLKSKLFGLHFFEFLILSLPCQMLFVMLYKITKIVREF